MSQIKFLTGTTAQLSSYIGRFGELTVNTETHELRFHDGEIAGGIHVFGSIYQELEQLLEVLSINNVSGLQSALDGLVEGSEIGTFEGQLVPLDQTGVIAESHLPQYLVDVETYASEVLFPASGEAGKIYVAEDVNSIFRWSGSTYFRIMPGVPHTDLLPEGTNNLYQTDEHTRDAFSVDGDLTYDPETGVIGYITPAAPTAADIGLGNVANYQLANGSEELEGLDYRYSTPIGIKVWFTNELGFYENEGEWGIDEGEMGFQDEMSALTGMSFSYEGEPPAYDPTLPTGTTAENDGLTLDAGMLAVDTEKNALRLHDGTTQGGFEFILEE